jgi:excisionase family DNA binding protein
LELEPTQGPGGTADNEEVLMVEEAAEFLRVHPSTLYRLLNRGELPGAFKMGKVWRIKREGLEGFVAPRVKKGASPKKRPR